MTALMDKMRRPFTTIELNFGHFLDGMLVKEKKVIIIDISLSVDQNHMEFFLFSISFVKVSNCIYLEL